MKTITSTLLFFFLSIFSLVQTSKDHSLTLDFEVTQDETGTIYCSLYDSEGSHMKKAIQSQAIEIVDNKAKVVFKNLPSVCTAILFTTM